MRLIPQRSLNYVSDADLRGQWRDCIALLGGKYRVPNRKVNYVWNYERESLIAYTLYLHSVAKRKKINLDETKIYKMDYDTEIVEQMLFYYRVNGRAFFAEHDSNMEMLFCIKSELKGTYYWNNISNFNRPEYMLTIMKRFNKFVEGNEGVKKVTVAKEIGILYDEMVERLSLIHAEDFKYTVE